MLNKTFLLLLLTLVGFSSTSNLQAQSKLYYYGSKDNDLLELLNANKIAFVTLDNLDKGILGIPKGSSLIITAINYPDDKVKISTNFYKIIEKNKIRLFIEYPDKLPINADVEEVHKGSLERGVITSPIFGESLPSMSILGINGCHIIPISVKDPLISYAIVAGLDKAEYGLTNTKVYPLLFQEKNYLIATTALSNFNKARFAPDKSWKIVWEYILGWLTRKNEFKLTNWKADPTPAFLEEEILPANARIENIRKGTDWFYKSHLLLHPTWKDEWLKYQSDGKSPFGPSINKNNLIGDGSMGILEGHASSIDFDGTQEYRYWIRSDVQGETAFALAAAGSILNEDSYLNSSEKLIDYMFFNSNARELTSDKMKASFGLLGWAYTHPQIIYNDDNARAVLGVIGASAYLKNERWNKLLVENILANFRTSSKQGFQGRLLSTHDIEKNGWEFYFQRDLINPHPHFESWMWACYLWLYDKTGYKPLLDKAKAAIKITMDSYPDKWKWTNGIQQERARMVLPLSWLLRIEDTEEHRRWLITIADELIANQQPNGAIREELGQASSGRYGKTKSNAEYGKHEAPLIFENGDKIADMLYTNNFAFFALNEAAKSTGMSRYNESVEKLSDFLTRIQVKSEKHPDLDGSWFRAFDYGRWEYWGSNADVGWGPWCTLAGWIQSWIVVTQALLEEEESFWDITNQINVKKEFEESLWMLK